MPLVMLILCLCMAAVGEVAAAYAFGSTCQERNPELMMLVTRANGMSEADSPCLTARIVVMQ